MIKLLGFILILLNLVSCLALVIKPTQKYTLKNLSTKDLKLEFFNKGNLLYQLDLKLAKSFDTTVSSNEPGAISNSPFPENADSINVKFSDGKIITHYCNGLIISRNANKCSFTKSFYGWPFIKSKPVNKSYYELVIDQADYNRAKFP